MQPKATNRFHIARLTAATALACWIAAVTPAYACPGQDKSYQRASLAANAASMMRLGLHGPRALETRDAADGNSLPAADADPSGAIVGLWQVTFLAGGHVVGQSFEVFHSDGTELSVDTTPPSLDNVCVGVWSQTGTFVYKLKHPSWLFDMNGNLIGTAIIRSVITLDRGVNKFTGTFTVDVFDNSSKLLDHAEGQLTATRIRPD